MALEQLRRGGKPAFMLFSEHEPLYDELLRSGRADQLAAWPSVTIERIAVRDHTLRPNWAQQQAHAALDRAIERELARELDYKLEFGRATASARNAGPGDSTAHGLIQKAVSE